MPTRLRPKAPLTPDAILVGDPGRSLLLAQELLEEPRMSNHARGLWGYTGRTDTGAELTIQATGIGGPSAAAVLADLVELGVKRAVRIGTCTGLGEKVGLGELLLVAPALAGGGSTDAFGVTRGDLVPPDPELLELLCVQLGDEARLATVASVDSLPAQAPDLLPRADAVDMQTATVLARAAQLGIGAAAVLIVAEDSWNEKTLDDEALEVAAKRAGHAVLAILSAST
jgi:uridine phosphorylase